jgi:hypothetical protein
VSTPSQTHNRFSVLSIAGGAAVAIIGLAGIVSAWSLDTGTLSEIGPGLFPLALAVLLASLAIAIILQGLRPQVDPDAKFMDQNSVRPIAAILGAILLFGFAIRPLGIAAAAPIALLVGGLASRETKWIEFIPFVIGLTAFCTILFRFVLSLPIPLAPWLMGY